MDRLILANLCLCHLALYIDEKGIIDFEAVYPICTEALKRHDKNIFDPVITTFKSLNRLNISRFNDLYVVKST